MTPRLLHLLRHGAPETPGLLMGRTDGAPTQAGIDACRARANDLAVTAIVSSDLTRASAAADAIGRDHGLPVLLDPRWRELDFGAWDGLAPSAVPAQAFARFHADPDANPPPGGERWSMLVDRVAAATAALTTESTLILTHGGAMRAAIAHLCGLTPAQSWAFDLPYASLLSLRLWPGPQPAAQIIGLHP